jgi:hypothetical protein
MRTTKAKAKVSTRHRAAAAAMMQGAKTMTTWRGSARPTAAISDLTIKRKKITRSSQRFLSLQQRARPSGDFIVGERPHETAPPGA